MQCAPRKRVTNDRGPKLNDAQLHSPRLHVRTRKNRSLPASRCKMVQAHAVLFSWLQMQRLHAAVGKDGVTGRIARFELKLDSILGATNTSGVTVLLSPHRSFRYP